jgi:hypothetical protein
VKSAALMVVAVLAAGCAAARQQYLTRHYVRVADALTSSTLGENLRVVPGALAAIRFNDVCRTAVPIARLVVVPRALDLVRGTTVSLSSFSVVALDGGGVVVRDQPIAIEVLDAAPPVLQLRSDDPDVAEGRLRAISSGGFKVRFRSICGMPYRQVEIAGQVR